MSLNILNQEDLLLATYWISFDPNTNTLIYSTDATGVITSEQPLDDSDLKDLRDAITREGFFSTHNLCSQGE